MNLKFALLVLLGGVSYGLLSTVIKLGFADGFTLAQLIGGQYIIGWAGLFLIVLLFSRHKVSRKRLGGLLLAGVPTGLTGIFYGIAVEELSASIAVVLLFQFTWIGVLLEAIAEKRLPSRAKLISIIILLLGTVLAGGILEGSTAAYTAKGMIFGLLSAFSFACYIFISSRVATEVPAYTKSFLMTTGAAIIISIVYPPVFLMDGALAEGLWKYVLFLGLFGVCIPIICFTIGTPKIGAGLGTILGAVELPAAIMASILLLQEHVSLSQWSGIILIFIGISVPQYIGMRRMRKFTIDNAV